jgi:hypothetical protein
MLWWRENRRLVALFAAAAAATAVAGLAYAATLSCATGLGARACELYRTASPLSVGVTAALAVMATVLGLLLGAGAVGGEVEGGTAAFAWSVAGSRDRWLRDRVLVEAGVLAALALACGAANAVIVAQLNSGHDISASFVFYGVWGPILIARALFGYAVGLAIGAWMGRAVPAFAAALALATVVLVAAPLVSRAFEPAHFVPVEDLSTTQAIGVDSGVLMPDGRLISFDECKAAEPKFPSDPEGSAQNAWEAQHCPMSFSFVTGSQMPAVEIREGTMEAALTLLAGALALALVRRRRL